MSTLTRIRTRNIGSNAGDLLARIRSGRMDLDPPYQRSSVWSLPQRRALVKSMLIGLPIPAVVVNSRVPGAWRDGQSGFGLIDGKQRLSTIMSFLDGEFSAPREWFDDNMLANPDAAPDLIGARDLSGAGAREIENWQVPLVQTEVATIAEEAELYVLLNSAGAAQTAEDLARAAAVAGGAR